MNFQSRTLRSLAVVIALGVLLHFLTGGTFSEARNLTNLTRQVAINGILAIGMTYVILIGGIDLSVGSVVALCGIAAGLSEVRMGWGVPASVAAAVISGLVIGAFNGWMITRYRIAPFIITLGMMVIARGAALIFSDGAAIAPTSDAFNELGQGYLAVMPTLVICGLVFGSVFYRTLRGKGPWSRRLPTLVGGAALAGGAAHVFGNYNGFPFPVLVFSLLALGGSFVLERTRIGRFTFAIGGNAEAAWLAGVPIRKLTLGIYTAMGALSGLCGAILTARLNGALPTAGELFELDAVAAVVIGGTSLQGGSGSVSGSILGAFLIGTLNNGMSLMAIPEFYQKVIKGVIIVLAVWIDTRSKAPAASPTR
jgi:ABC-type xylose transport system permease subunit